MAQLGLIESSAQAKQYDKAITAAQALVNNTNDETMPCARRAARAPDAFSARKSVLLTPAREVQRLLKTGE